MRGLLYFVQTKSQLPPLAVTDFRVAGSHRSSHLSTYSKGYFGISFSPFLFSPCFSPYTLLFDDGDRAQNQLSCMEQTSVRELSYFPLNKSVLRTSRTPNTADEIK